MAPTTLKDAWNEVAAGYRDYWAPRFRPWMEVAVAAMPAGLAGPIIVPCCGPGLELDLLAERFDRSRLTGVDFSESMVELCRSRGHHAELGDAMALSGSSNILSTFGLQQLPEPDAGLRHWAETLPPDGVLSVMLWPYDNDDGGPFDLLREWAEQNMGRTPPTWGDTLLDGLPAGLSVRDDTVRFPIHHDGGQAFWRALLKSGPGRALVDQAPAEVLGEMETMLAERWPGPFAHHPTARHIVVRT